MLNTFFVGFPKEKLILGVLEIPCTALLKKPEGAAARTTQPAQKLENT